MTRFKNGYLVDGFKDLSIANLENPNFNAAVAFDREILTPSVRTFPIDLKYTTAINSTLFPSNNFAEIATLSRNAHVSIINQPYATNSRNCVSNFYKYEGEGVISPPYDAAYDTTTNPLTCSVLRKYNFESATKHALQERLLAWDRTLPLQPTLLIILIK